MNGGRPEREEIDFASRPRPRPRPRTLLRSKSEDENEDENDDDKNKKAFIPAKQRMKAPIESRSAHTERAGLILLLTEKLPSQLIVEN